MKKNPEELREKIVEYVRKRNLKGMAPSIKQLTTKFRINNTKMYLIFPGGEKEIYEKAGCSTKRIEFRIAKMNAVSSGREIVKTGNDKPTLKAKFLQTKSVLSVISAINEMKFTFLRETESIKDETFWNGRRENYVAQCESLIAEIKERSNSWDPAAEADAKDALTDLKAQFHSITAQKLYSEVLDERLDALVETSKELASLDHKLKFIKSKIKAIARRYELREEQVVATISITSKILEKVPPTYLPRVAIIIEEARRRGVDCTKFVDYVLQFGTALDCVDRTKQEQSKLNRLVWLTKLELGRLTLEMRHLQKDVEDAKGIFSKRQNIIDAAQLIAASLSSLKASAKLILDQARTSIHPGDPAEMALSLAEEMIDAVLTKFEEELRQMNFDLRHDLLESLRARAPSPLQQD